MWKQQINPSGFKVDTLTWFCIAHLVLLYSNASFADLLYDHH